MATTATQPQDIEAVVIEALAEFGADADALTRDATLDSVDVDSLDLVELVKALEDRFGITISDDDLKPIESVGDAIALTMRLSEAEEGAPA